MANWDVDYDKGDGFLNLLITGGCGFLGSNLAAFGIENGYNVTIFDNLSRKGSNSNFNWLSSLGKFRFVHGDIRNKNDVDHLIGNEGYGAIFHLAGQVAMTTSIEDPYKDFEINVGGTLNILDAVRKYSNTTSIFYSSSNKVYGDLEQYTYIETPTRYICSEFPEGFNERTPLDFHSPYGCSKGAADQYMLDFNRIFGLKTVVFRHSSMYGSRQFSTYDQGWIGWFCQKAIEQKTNNDAEIFTISGNGKQVRDILHAQDMIRLYFTSLQFVEKMQGNAFNIGGSIEQSLSLIELFQLLEEKFNIKLKYKHLPPRESDQKVFVSDISKITSYCGWKPTVSSKQGINKMIDWIIEDSNVE